jgi:rhodanese-related sulfurtransferase
MDVPEITIDDLAEKQAAGAVVVDVRQPDEYEEGHVPGAVLIPLDQIPDRVGELPEGIVYVICAMGGRSAKAVEFLGGRGLDAVNVAGGTQGWVESGRAVVTGTQPR